MYQMINNNNNNKKKKKKKKKKSRFLKVRFKMKIVVFNKILIQIIIIIT